MEFLIFYIFFPDIDTCELEETRVTFETVFLW